MKTAVSRRSKKRTASSRGSSQAYWLVKQEPTAYAWERFVREGGTAWTGVRNPQARANLRAMRAGDAVLFYHSVIGKEVVGLAEVTREAYPDKDAPAWAVVDLEPVHPMAKPVTLAQIKRDPALKEVALVRQARLSVMPLTRKQFARIIALSEQRR